MRLTDVFLEKLKLEGELNSKKGNITSNYSSISNNHFDFSNICELILKIKLML